MIYIYTEDSSDGFELCKQIKKLYLDNIFDDICIDTLGGIWNLKDTIKNIITKFQAQDRLIIIYDDIRENPIISTEINKTLNFLYKNNLHNIVYWIPTKSFELELLFITGFEFFTNIVNYNKYFYDLRKIYIETQNLASLTKISKNNILYNEMYEKVRKNKITRGKYKNLSHDDFEKSITIETIAKSILNKIFENNSINKPMDMCWINNCCYRKNKCQNQYIDFNKIIETQKQEDMYKTKFIILNTSYKLLIDTVYKLHDMECNLSKIDITDFVLK